MRHNVKPCTHLAGWLTAYCRFPSTEGNWPMIIKHVTGYRLTIMKCTLELVNFVLESADSRTNSSPDSVNDLNDDPAKISIFYGP